MAGLIQFRVAREQLRPTCGVDLKPRFARLLEVILVIRPYLTLFLDSTCTQRFRKILLLWDYYTEEESGSRLLWCPSTGTEFDPWFWPTAHQSFPQALRISWCCTVLPKSKKGWVTRHVTSFFFFLRNLNLEGINLAQILITFTTINYKLL